MTSLLPPDSLERRAELFSVIVDLIRQWDQSSEPTSTQPSGLPQPASLAGTPVSRDALLPRIRIIQQRVLCNGAALDLTRRPLTLRLFEAFCAAPDYQIAREDMLRLVYRVSDFAGRSVRYTEAVYNNGVKLISRARLHAALHLSPAVRHGIEWFVYDQERKMWCLYRLRPEYLNNYLS